MGKAGKNEKTKKDGGNNPEGYQPLLFSNDRPVDPYLSITVHFSKFSTMHIHYFQI